MDSSLSSVPPVWPRPRPLIFPNGTPHAATTGPTAIVILSPDAARRVLVDDAAPEPSREVDRLAARHHRIGQGKGLRRGQTAEPDRHEEGRRLVVGDVPAHVAGDELADVGGGELLAVPLALDQLGGMHRARAYSSGSTRRRSVERDLPLLAP